MLDYHLHLWPHSQSETPLDLEQLAAYCERAQAVGVTELALTEHLFRFRQADALLRGFWEDERVPPALAASMAQYWDFHATADLDEYVECAQEAAAAGLPIVIGLEVDHYAGRMDAVGSCWAGIPSTCCWGRCTGSGDGASTTSTTRCRWRSGRRARWTTAGTPTPRRWRSWPHRGACDVLAHPDLIKVAGHVPDAPAEWWDRIADAAKSSGMAAELSSAGWRKPVGEQYPASGLLERFVTRGVPLTTASDAHHLGYVADRADDLRALLARRGGHAPGVPGRAPRPVPLAAARTGA